MTEHKRERIFGVAETPGTFLEGDWREVPRLEMFERLIVAVDGAKAEAEEIGDENYVQHVDTMLFPFLQSELEKAMGSDEMTEQERRVYDARADYEAWGHAWDILEP